MSDVFLEVTPCNLEKLIASNFRVDMQELSVSGKSVPTCLITRLHDPSVSHLHLYSLQWDPQVSCADDAFVNSKMYGVTTIGNGRQHPYQWYTKQSNDAA